MRFLRLFVILFLAAVTSCAAPTQSPPDTSAAPALQFIEFYSPLWATCRQVLPIVHGLEDEYSDRIEFVRVNIHKPSSQALMEQYGFTTSPELYLVADGRVIGAWDDFVAAEDLRQAFDSALEAVPVER